MYETTSLARAKREQQVGHFSRAEVGHSCRALKGGGREKIIEGVRIGDRVVVLGSLVRSEKGERALDAEVVIPGSAANYLAEAKESAEDFGILGWIFAGLGVLLLGVAVLVAWLMRHRPRRAAST